MPSDLKLNGEEINIWYTNDQVPSYTDINPELSGDVMDDAVYNLNLAVQNRLDCKLNFSQAVSESAQCHNEISKLLLADDTSYDVFS